MVETLVELFSSNPVLLLFLVLAIGFVIGGIRIGSFQLGSVVGVLLAGLVLGHLGFESNAAIQSFGFTLFIFAVGYQAGPKFIEAVKKDGRRYFVIALLVATSGFAIAYGVSILLNFEPGLSAGVLAGALTSTPTLAASISAVEAPDYLMPDGYNLESIKVNITSAYAITYIFGLVGLILVIRFLPKLFGIDLAKVAEQMEHDEKAKKKQPLFSQDDIVVRAIRLESEELTGKPLGELYERSPFQLTVQKIIRNDELIHPTLETQLQIGDLISIVGVLEDKALEQLKDKVIGSQVRNRELLRFDAKSAKICVTRKGAATGKTLGELKTPVNYASFVSSVSRLGVELDVSSEMILERGDVLDVTGPGSGLEALGAQLGHLEQDMEKTDLSTFSWAIVIGILIGTMTISVAGISLGLGTAGGLLGTGILAGYLSSVFPVFGQVPAGARWVFTELGLLLFMACVGLQGGAGLLETLKESGLELIIIGIIVTIVPVALTYLYGKFVFKMNPLMLFGAIVGAMTSGGALSVINSQSKSTIASIGYTGAYAFANVLLTIAGALIMLL
jgi:putative transport protein